MRVREALVRLDQLVLPDKTRQSLDMALAHVRNADTLLNDWGLGHVIAYGRAVTLLFSGPPGTGKTATAEAVAHELKKPILLADYTRIQNCYVGNTEKNIVGSFLTPGAQCGALLGRGRRHVRRPRDGTAKWEVREVNVLLQELERHEGVCILATNRKIALDDALERRITLKVEFDRPDRGMRRQIWEKHPPSQMPLAADVNADRMSEWDLAGGEIKNVVLNAARLALGRCCQGPVEMKDFTTAVSLELDGTLEQPRRACDRVWM